MTIDEILARSAELDSAQQLVNETVKDRYSSDDDYAAWFKATREMAAAFPGYIRWKCRTRMRA